MRRSCIIARDVRSGKNRENSHQTQDNGNEKENLLNWVIYIYIYVFFASGISSTVLASRLIHVFWIGFLKINIFYLLCGLFVGDIVCRLSSAIITKHNQEIRVFDSMFGLPQIEQLPMSNQLWGSLCLAMQGSCSSNLINIISWSLHQCWILRVTYY